MLIKGLPLVLSGSIMMDSHGLDRPLLIGGRPGVVASGRTYGGAIALVYGHIIHLHQGWRFPEETPFRMSCTVN